ncbi:MAG TPA: hypothetical protein VJ739_17410 [Gemmataceae bacterium]|nr:hypothetical protein [Gemmataceae bacterium]
MDTNGHPGYARVQRGFPLVAAVLLGAAVCACSAYANLRGNMNGHLGGEYLQIARALASGRGFADPFGRKTGPTAWQPPLLPALLAGLLWACDGNEDAVVAVVVFLQVAALVGTGALVLALARETTRRVGPPVAAAVFFLALLCNFKLCFQQTHDSWLVLLTVDLLLAGLCWLRPLGCWRSAAGWGLFGGFCALVSPIVGMAWGALSMSAGLRGRAWLPLIVAGLTAALALAPWTVRNYLVFGRLVPVKSNLAYELYQSQCLQKDGLLQGYTFSFHPYHAGTREGLEYSELGEAAYLDRKREQYWQAVRADPLNFLDRVACRLLGATLWYEPINRAAEARARPWALRLSRLTYPLPFLGLLLLLLGAAWRPLARAQWLAVGFYGLYLLPYIGASYYERYGMPLLGIKVLLVLWAADRLLSRATTADSRNAVSLIL